MNNELILESKIATDNYTKRNGKSSYSLNREGNIYLVDNESYYVLIEDNGTRGLFQAIGTGLSISPTTIIRFNDSGLTLISK